MIVDMMKQYHIESLLTEIKEASGSSAGFTLEFMLHSCDDRPDIEYCLWVGILQKSYRFNTLEELLSWRESIIKIVQAAKIEKDMSATLQEESEE